MIHQKPAPHTSPAPLLQRNPAEACHLREVRLRAAGAARGLGDGRSFAYGGAGGEGWVELEGGKKCLSFWFVCFFVFFVGLRRIFFIGFCCFLLVCGGFLAGFWWLLMGFFGALFLTFSWWVFDGLMAFFGSLWVGFVRFWLGWIDFVRFA